MANIAEEIQDITNGLPKGVRLVAISKYHPASAIQEAYDAGQRIFGESHVQEIQEKHPILPQDIEWHFIGHLQTNKVKYIVPYITLIHSVDSPRLLAEIQKQASRVGRTIGILLQLHIAREETKFGFSLSECEALMQQGTLAQDYPNICFKGLMCMASNTDDMEQVRREFHLAHTFFTHMKETCSDRLPDFRELSMGMSHDYQIAIQEGSTLIRVGSKIFGERGYFDQ